MDLITVKEAAKELRVSPVTVRRYIKSGRLRCIRLGRTIRLRREDVEALAPTDEAAEFWRNVKPTSEDDPFWRIIGMADFEDPHGSKDIHRAISDAYDAHLHRARGE
jgi:excisionase family DNA binding protein